MFFDKSYSLPLRIAFLMAVISLAGCSSTASSSSNAPDGKLTEETKREEPVQTVSVDSA